MPDIYLADAFRFDDDDDDARFSGVSQLEIVATVSGFAIGPLPDDDPSIVVRDLTLGTNLDIDFTDVTRLGLRAEGEPVTGTFLAAEADLPGDAEALYVVRIEGAPVPAPRVGEEIDDYIRRIGVESEERLSDDPDSPFASGKTLLFDDIADFSFEGPGLSIGEAQRVALLYEAALDRDGAIDAAGLNFWIDSREAGESEVRVAEAFLDNPEFRAAFGEAVDPAASDYLDDVELVAQLYRNVLDRDGDPAGIAFWTGVLDSGASRGEVLLEFATVPENARQSPFVFEDLVEVEEGTWTI